MNYLIGMDIGTIEAASLTGLLEGTPIAGRAGDQAG